MHVANASRPPGSLRDVAPTPGTRGEVQRIGQKLPAQAIGSTIKDSEHTEIAAEKIFD